LRHLLSLVLVATPMLLSLRPARWEWAPRRPS
jgi:hypothetical protein